MRGCWVVFSLKSPDISIASWQEIVEGIHIATDDDESIDGGHAIEKVGEENDRHGGFDSKVDYGSNDSNGKDSAKKIVVD